MEKEKVEIKKKSNNKIQIPKKKTVIKTNHLKGNVNKNKIVKTVNKTKTSKIIHTNKNKDKKMNRIKKKPEYKGKTIYIGSDHAGFKLKEKIKEWLINSNMPFLDLGNTILDKNDDYPDFAIKVSNLTSSNNSKGILVCGSGQGMCMAANKIKGIRAGIAYTVRDARLLREHNNANIMCLSGWGMSFEDSKKMIKKFLDTEFSSEPRHKRRIGKIMEI